MTYISDDKPMCNPVVYFWLISSIQQYKEELQKRKHAKIFVMAHAQLLTFPFEEVNKYFHQYSKGKENREE